MSIGCRIVLLILWVYVVFTCALLLFSKGFLLNRVVINNASECQTAHWMVNNLQKGIHSHIRIDETSQKRNVENKLKIKCGVELQPKFQKAILVIIDGLRYDFLTYNPDLDLKAVLPFENKMVKLYNLLSEQPANGKLFKFEADPPTTTMQRIKGITTGSLPTFVDAGTNFNSYEITEDNILSQTLKQNKNISFMGCSTWTELFPTHFHRKIPFSALNVRDLDTIDYGIMRNILQEVKRDDWSLLIAHFLGVDHCGHRYGTHHPEMTRKLTEMDKVIKDLTETMDEETILFVMGDHGMTRSGDHGGDSKDEVMAGLFVYSKKGLFQPTQDHLDLPKVSQIDLVPTLSLLLDQPIPFSNLGTIIPQFFQGPSKPYLPHYLKQSLPTNDATRELIARLFQQINAAHVSHLNTKQLFGFINEYQKVSTDLPFAKVEAARINFDFLDDKFEENLQELLNLDFTDPSKLQTRLKDLEELVLEFQNVHELLQGTLLDIKDTCRSVWAKFDVISMTMGISLMAFLGTFVLAAPHFFSLPSIVDPGRLFGAMLFTGFGFCAVAFYFSLVGTQETERDSIIVFLALSFSFSLWLQSISVVPTYSTLKIKLSHLLNWTSLNRKWLVFSACFFIQCGSYFANSYIIHEDTVTLFFNQSLLLYTGFSFVVDIIREAKTSNTSKQSKPRSFALMKTRLIKSITETSNLTTLSQIAMCLLCLRTTKYFWFCREMQLRCNFSSYVLPLVSLMSEFTIGHVNERLFVALISMVSLLLSTYFYLKKRGSLKGNSPSVFSVKYISILMVVMILLHWCLQVMLTHPISNLFDVQTVQQIILPRLVYVLFLICLFCMVHRPLPVYMYEQEKRTTPQDFHNQEIKELYHQLRQQLGGSYLNKEAGDEQKLYVYGMRTVYSSSFISLLFMLLLTTCMVMMDGMALPMFCLWITSFVVTKMFAINRPATDMSEVFICSAMWMMFSSVGFYGSGHQNTIPSVRYPAAYIGFRGSIPEIVPQAMVILLNTFASPIICGLALPMLLITNKGRPTNTDPDAQHSNGHVDSEIDVLENKNRSFLDLYRIAVTYLGLFMLKVSFAAGSAAFHRRHLMVWKIFAPRFMFEAVAFILSVPFVIAGILFFKRVDNRVAEFLTKLQERWK